MSELTGPGYREVPPALSADRPPARGRAQRLLIAVVAVLGVLNFLLGFAPYDVTDGTEVPGIGTVGAFSGNFFQSGTGGLAALALLFAAGLIAGCGLLPRQTVNLPTVVGLTVAGALTMTLVAVYFPDRVDLGLGFVLVLIFGLAQAVAAIAALALPRSGGERRRTRTAGAVEVRENMA